MLRKDILKLSHAVFMWKYSKKYYGSQVISINCWFTFRIISSGNKSCLEWYKGSYLEQGVGLEHLQGLFQPYDSMF